MDTSRFVQTDIPHLLRDKTNMAIINNDVRKYEAYKKNKELRKQKDNELSDLKEQLKQMQELLQSVVNKPETSE